MAEGPEPEILFETRGPAGLITLNRPKALNALSLAMMQAMRAQLAAWEADSAVTRVILRSSSPRAFCAGGDIRAIYELGKAGRIDEALAFFEAEYQLDAAVKRFPKPYVSLIEGIVMGGGVGISLHGDFRVAAESYVFAMPETAIGYFPDVGMTYAFPRLPGRIGTYLAMSGARIGAGDALAVDLATHVAKASAFDAITDALVAGRPVEAALNSRAALVPGPGVLVKERGLIDECFSARTVEDVLERLDIAASSHSHFATETAKTIRSRSPTSVHVAFEQMRRGGDMSFAEAMACEYRLCSRFVRGHDFYEGVRAAVIDKDNAPAWRPAILEAVDPAAIEAAFGPLDGPEPDFG